MAGQSKELNLTATVLLKSGYRPDVSLVCAIFKSRLPGSPDPKEESQTANSTELKIGDNRCFISYEVEPFPKEDLQVPCQQAWHWPEASTLIGSHSAFVRLAMTGQSSSLLKHHIEFTHMVASVAQASDSVGIFWEGSQAVHDSGQFQSQSEDLSERTLVPQLWVDMRVEKKGDSAYRFFSTGLSCFDLPEIEIPDSKRSIEEVFEFGYSVVYYSLSKQVGLADGATIGRADDEKFSIRRQPSYREPDREVVAIQFD